MSWSRRSALLAGFALAGCGFEPVFAPGGSAGGLVGQVAIDPPRDAPGFAFVRHLETRLGLTDAPVYRLSADIAVDEKELGITPDQVISRFQLVGRARYTLIRVETRDVVAQGLVDTFTSFSATSTPFATRSARRDARDRLMVVLADQIVAELLVTAGDWP